MLLPSVMSVNTLSSGLVSHSATETLEFDNISARWLLMPRRYFFTIIHHQCLGYWVQDASQLATLTEQVQLLLEEQAIKINQSLEDFHDIFSF